MAQSQSTSLRLTGHGLAPDRARVRFTFDGMSIEALAGESLAAALLAEGLRPLRRTRFNQAPRTFYCGMGVCQDCLVSIDGRENVRACMETVRDGMVVASGGAP